MSTATTTMVRHRPANSSDLLDLRFPQKLWLLVNKPHHISTAADSKSDSDTPTVTPSDLCVWSRHGTAIRVRVDLLDAYLAGLNGRSLFRCQLPGQWLRQLRVYGFQRLGGDLPAASAAASRAALLQLLHQQQDGTDDAHPLDVDVHEYRHEAFRRDRPQLIDTIRMPAVAAQTPAQQRAVAMLRHHRHTDAKRRVPDWDPCTRLYDRDSGACMQQPRGLQLRTLLRDRAVREMLAQKLDRCKRTNDCQIELESDVFQNAADSESGFEQREVAGYYGENVSARAVRAFFGEYLPTYANEEGASSLTMTGDSQQPPDATGETTNVEGVTQSAAAAADAFAIMPQFQIVHNATAADPSQAYSLMPMVDGQRSAMLRAAAADPVVSSDYGLQALANINHFTPIQYDTSFLDDVPDFGDDAIKDEVLPPEEVLEKPPVVNDDDDDDDNFHIDQFFCMKPRPTNACDVPAATDEQTMQAPNNNVDDSIDPLDAELQAMQQDVDATLQKAAQAIPATAANVAMSIDRNDADDESTATSDIIQQAAIIDDDFFSEIRESMDVLYDKML